MPPLPPEAISAYFEAIDALNIRCPYRCTMQGIYDDGSDASLCYWSFPDHIQDVEAFLLATASTPSLDRRFVSLSSVLRCFTGVRSRRARKALKQQV